VVELPQAPSQPWTVPRSDIPAGQVTLHRLHSDVLNDERRVWVYTPHDYQPEGMPNHRLLILDGWFYVHVLGAPTILDNLIAEAVIPPLVAVMVGSNYDQTRGRDLGCYEPYLDFLADELMPWARQRYHIMHDPADHAGRYEPRRVGDSLCRIAMVSTSIGLLATIRPRPLGGVWLFIG
jgi:enterochelin esterase family protein